jgi:hypothetical protein
MTSRPTIKHWRSFGAEEWGHVKDGAVGLLLGSLVPVALFYVSFRTWGFSTAVVLVLIWSAAIFTWHYRRAHGADVFSGITFCFACVKAAAGLITQNESLLGDNAVWLYLAWPSLENIIYGTTFFGSALLGRPILALYAQRLYPIPVEVQSSSTFRRAFVVVSAAWLVGHGVRAIVRLWLLATLPLEWYLIADTVAGWPINVSLVTLTGWYPLRQLHRAGYMSVSPQPLSTMDAVELAVEEAAPTTV